MSEDSRGAEDVLEVGEEMLGSDSDSVARQWHSADTSPEDGSECWRTPGSPPLGLGESPGFASSCAGEGQLGAPSSPPSADSESPSSTSSEMGQLFSRAGRGPSRSTPKRGISNGALSDDSVNSVGLEGMHLASFDGQSTVTLAPGDPEYRIPIIGYEINEERARFTIYKVRVEHPVTCRHWFVFRRYTDFARLNRKLKTLFPGLKFSVPPKRWFGDNFESSFLEDRLNGLQAFVNNLMVNEEVKKSPAVREFFCLDEPPGPEDGFEESRALCESLEETLIEMQHIRREKEKEMDLLKGEVSMLKTQMKMLIKSLRMECSITSTVLSRLQKAQELSASRESICSSDASGCRYSSLHNIIRDHSFNVTFVEIMEKSLGALGLSNSESLASVAESGSATEEITDSSATLHNNASNQPTTLETPRAVQIPVTVHATMVENISRSTGDGSTGSSERLPPVGGILDNAMPIERARTPDVEEETFPHKDSLINVPETTPLNSPPIPSSLFKEISPVSSSTPKKCIIDNAIVRNGVTNITLEA